MPKQIKLIIKPQRMAEQLQRVKYNKNYKRQQLGI